MTRLSLLFIMTVVLRMSQHLARTAAFSTVGFRHRSMFGRPFTHATSTFQRFLSSNSEETTNAPRHDVRSSDTFAEIDEEEMKIQQALRDHQQKAPRLGFPTDVRTLVQYNHGYAVMSTNSKS